MAERRCKNSDRGVLEDAPDGQLHAAAHARGPLAIAGHLPGHLLRGAIAWTELKSPRKHDGMCEQSCAAWNMWYMSRESTRGEKAAHRQYLATLQRFPPLRRLPAWAGHACSYV